MKGTNSNIYGVFGNKSLKENKTINDNNIKLFKRELLFGDIKGLKCCLCGVNISISDSYSNRGDRLICHTCYWNKFKNVEEARKWIDREAVDNA